MWNGSALNATDYFINAFQFLPPDARPTKPRSNMNEFGGSIDGRIRRDKLFFFTDVEGPPLRSAFRRERHRAQQGPDGRLVHTSYASGNLMRLVAHMSGGLLQRTSARRSFRGLQETEQPLLRQFYSRFNADMRWFFGPRKLIQEFVRRTSNCSAAISYGSHDDSGTVRVIGLTGRGLSEEDQQFVTELQAELKSSFPELTETQTPFQVYEWMCRNLEKLPDSRLTKAEKIVERVGLESGDATEIAVKSSELFAGFILFSANGHKASRVSAVGSATLSSPPESGA